MEVCQGRKSTSLFFLWTGHLHSLVSQPHFKFNTVLPDLIVGRLANPTPGFYFTHTLINGFFNGDPSFMTKIAAVAGWYVSSTDVALIHIGTLLEGDVVNERVWAAAGGGWTLNDVLKVWREAYPDKQILGDLELPEQAKILIDNRRGLELIKRYGKDGWTSFRESFLENVQGQ